jgi:hypothetical protein
MTRSGQAKCQGGHENYAEHRSADPAPLAWSQHAAPLACEVTQLGSKSARGEKCHDGGSDRLPPPKVEAGLHSRDELMLSGSRARHDGETGCVVSGPGSGCRGNQRLSSSGPGARRMHAD